MKLHAPPPDSYAIVPAARAPDLARGGPIGEQGEGSLNRILVASDVSAYSDRAVDRAVLLAKENHAALCFLHAIEPGALPESYVQGNVEEAKRDLEHEVQDSGIDKRLRVSVAVGRGDTDEFVVDEAQSMQADLIVMGLSHDVAGRWLQLVATGLVLLALAWAGMWVLPPWWMFGPGVWCNAQCARLNQRMRAVIFLPDPNVLWPICEPMA